MKARRAEQLEWESVLDDVFEQVLDLLPRKATAAARQTCRSWYSKTQHLLRHLKCSNRDVLFVPRSFPALRQMTLVLPEGEHSRLHPSYCTRCGAPCAPWPLGRTGGLLQRMPQFSSGLFSLSDVP